MRNLTLNEKIGIKGVLSKYDIQQPRLARLDMADALFLWGICCGKSISLYYMHRTTIKGE